MRSLYNQRSLVDGTGFTIIELLVTVSVMAILLGISLAGYLQFNQKQRVQQTARDVRQLFVETRRKAQVKDQTGCEGDTVTGYAEVSSYSVQIKDQGSTIGIYSLADCIPDNSGNNVKFLTVPSGLEVMPDYDYLLTYSPLTTQVGCPTVPCVGLPHSIVISDGQTRFGFSITAGGQITGVEPISDDDFERFLEEMSEQPGAMSENNL